MELKELIERVRAAKGRDQELAMDFAAAVLGGEWRLYSDTRRVRNKWLYDDGGKVLLYGTDQPERWFNSIDSALSLVEIRLPGWTYNVGNTGPDDACWACLTQPDGDCTDFGSSAETIPRAIILALLTALDQKEENK